MGSRPTISDLAKAAGVSVATVDRVLNGRHAVREDTSRRVYEAATEIGFHAVGLIKQRVFSNLPNVRLGIILQKPESDFYKAFGVEVQEAVRRAQNIRGVCVLEYLEAMTPAQIVAKVREIAPKVQALALTAVDHPNVTAVVAELRSKGIPVFSLLSDFAIGVRTGYVGVDNRKAGRVAAWAIAKTAKKPGKVAVFVGSHRFLGHDLREMGFRTYFRENAPDFQLLDTLVNLEEPQFTYGATLDLIARHKDLCGFYVAGGGMEGAIEALRESDAQNLTVVCNELTMVTRSALADQVVSMTISTPLRYLSQRLVDLMVNSASKSEVDLTSQLFLPFDLHISENI